MFFKPDLGGRNQSMDDGEQPGLPVAMTAPINGNGFQPEIDSSEMGAGDAGLAQDRRCQQSAEPGRVLQHGQFVPGIKCDDDLQHRRQVLRLPQHAAPFLRASSSQSRS